jgi:hypothetical protein
MATQPITPQEDLQNQQLVFTYINNQLTVSSPGLIVNQGDTVNFSNSQSSTTSLVITFLAGPQPPNINPIPAPFQNVNVAPGASNPQQAPMSDVSVNYSVNAGGQTFGPYAIQVGVGPVYVELTNSAPNQTHVAIPEGGWLEMFSTDVTYYLKWTSVGGSPFPGLTTVYQATPSSNPNVPYQNTVNGALFAYQITTTPPTKSSPETEHDGQSKPIEISEFPRIGAGPGGRVIIQNT